MNRAVHFYSRPFSVFRAWFHITEYSFSRLDSSTYLFLSIFANLRTIANGLDKYAEPDQIVVSSATLWI